MQTESHNHTDRRIRGVSSCINALRENGRPIAGGRFLCAEGQAVPSSRWTGLVEAVTSPDQKGNRYRNRARVNNSPSKGRGTRRTGATRASNSDDQTRFLYGVFPGNGLVVDPACGRRPGPQVIASCHAGCKKPRSVSLQEPFAQPLQLLDIELPSL